MIDGPRSYRKWWRPTTPQTKGSSSTVSASLLLISFGDEGQRTAATYLLGVLLTMGGGYGLIAALTRGVGRFLRP
jgi:hypothetical protein